MILSIDLETRSPVDLKKSGAYRYFENPHTSILCAAWAIDDGPVSVWLPGERCPLGIQAAVASGAEISGWNVNFERQGWNHILGPRHGWPVPHLDQYRDTAAQAAAQALPRALEKAANVLQMPERKDLAGSVLMRNMSRPRKPHKGEPRQAIYWYEGDIGRLAEYCKQDVVVERAIRKKLRPLSPEEFLLWRFDQLINDRGIMLDLDLVDDMAAIVDQHADELDRRMLKLTGCRCAQTGKFKTWLATHQVRAESLAKGVIDDVMGQAMPPTCLEALEVWQEASTASVRKLKAAKACAGGDGRARGLLLFHGATSGRWSGQLWQPQNLPRGSGRVSNQDQAIDLIRHRRADLLGWAYDNPLTAVSDCLRGVMCAAPGKTLISGDYVNVEARVTAWLAGSAEKLEQFRLQDSGEGAEVYRLAASRIYNIAVQDVSKAQRQTGKTAELACLAADTRVLTNNGIKPIIDVKLTDRVWDGESWVRHQGLIARGKKPILRLDGLGVTPDHLITTGRTWRPAQQLASNAESLCHALAHGSASLPSSTIFTRAWVASPTAKPNAHVEPIRIASRSTTSAAVPRRDAMLAQRSNRISGGRAISATPISSLMRSTAGGCSIALQPASRGVVHRPQAALTSTTVDAASMYSRTGASAQKAAASFSPILSDYLAGTNQSWRSIASMSTRDMNPATFVSRRGVKTRPTSDLSQSCKPASMSLKPVYDLAHAGPRNRFTVLTNSGALIVHNCGFGGGVDALARMARSYHIDMEVAFPSLWESAAPEDREQADERHADVLAKGNNDWLPRKAWQACWLTVRAWRRANKPIVDMWSEFHSAAWHTMEEKGVDFPVGKVVFRREGGFLWLTLPSGRKLAYPTPATENLEVPWSDKRLPVAQREHKDMLTVLAFEKGKSTRYPFYPGLAFQHAVQAIARDLLANGMHRVETAGYPVVMSIHDEVISEIPDGAGDVDRFTDLLSELPAWAAGIPLLADGWSGYRYRKSA